MSNNKAILVGGFHETIELCNDCGVSIVGIIDNKLNGQYFGCNIIGCDADAPEIYKMHRDIPVILTPDEPLVRKKLAKQYKEIGFKFMNLIHPQAKVSRSAKMGEGIIIHYGSHISSNVAIDDYVRVNTYANIMHDSHIGKYSTVAPNAVVLGGVTISENCYIGANCTILPGLNIEADSIIGAGAIVTKDVKTNSKMIGIAAKEMNKGD